MCSSFLISCSSNSTKPADKNSLTVLMDDSNDVRIRKALERTDSTDRKDDTVKLTALLQLPEIEIPKAKVIGTKKQGKVLFKDTSVSAFNGHVCVQTILLSEKNFDYTGIDWTAELRINGKLVKNENEVSQKRNFDFNKLMTELVHGQVDIRTCSKKKFKKVSKVSLLLKDAFKKKLGQFDWSSPWPAVKSK